MSEAAMKQSAFAAHRGVSRKTVTVWKQKGLLVFSLDGNVDVVASEKLLLGAGLIDDFVTPGNNEVTLEAQSGETLEEAADRLAPALLSQFATKADAERYKETYLALLKKLEYDEKSREVVRVAEVARIVGGEYSKVRSKLMEIPSVVAPMAVLMKTAEEIRALIEKEIARALEELAYDGNPGTDS